MKKILFVAVLCILMILPSSFAENKEPQGINLTNYEGVSYGDVTITWSGVEEAEYYLFTLVNTVGNETIIDSIKVSQTEYTIDQNLLDEVNRYDVKVASVINNIEYWNIGGFTTLRDFTTIDEPALNHGDNRFETEQENIVFNWKWIDHADEYKITLIDLTTNVFVINDSVTRSYYTITRDNLIKDHDYKFKVEVIKGPLSDYDEVEFYVKNTDDALCVIHNPLNNTEVPKKNLYITWSGGRYIDHYLITVEDKETGSKLCERVKLDFAFYDIDEKLLAYGHEYKISIATVIDGKEKWVESNFSVEYPSLEIPHIENLKNKSSLEMNEIKIVWTGTSFIDYYLISVKNMIDNTEIIEKEKVGIPNYNISENLLKYGHTYKIIITTVRGSKSEESETIFSINSVSFEKPEFIGLKDSYNINDVVFRWDEVVGANLYLLSLQNTDTKKMIYVDQLNEYTSHTINADKLEENNNYRLLLVATSGDYKQSAVHDFRVLGNEIKYSSSISTWAQDFVQSIKEKKVLDEAFYTSLISKPKDNLTRAEFCEMLVSLYDTVEFPVVVFDSSLSKVFQDISNLPSETQAVILKANALGIISGTSETTFNPLGNVTRQEMAVMLLNTYRAMYGDTSSEWKVKFADEIDIAPWAIEGVKFSNAMEILSGDGERFNPNDLATHEMGFVLLDKAINSFDK